jgi:hypothetical protein
MDRGVLVDEVEAPMENGRVPGVVLVVTREEEKEEEELAGL